MRGIARLGELTEHPSVREWWASEPVPVPLVSGASLRFVITEERAAWEHAKDVEDAVERFLNLTDEARLAETDKIYAHYKECRDARDRDIPNLPIAKPEDVWKHVTPHEVLVSRRPRRDEGIYVTLAFECDWDPDDGLQLVFFGGDALVRVSKQDGNLTTADAMNIADEDDALLMAARRARKT